MFLTVFQMTAGSPVLECGPAWLYRSDGLLEVLSRQPESVHATVPESLLFVVLVVIVPSDWFWLGGSIVGMFLLHPLTSC